jgi:hypothetical protein
MPEINMTMHPYKGLIIDDPNFRILFENTVMKVGHVFETSYCYNKLTKEEFAIFEFGNDPTCGLVGQRNDWCLIGGDVLVLRTWVDNTLRLVGELKEIFDLKLIDAYTIQVLTDPWADNSEIWQLTIDLNKLTRPLTLKKIRDFKEFVDKPYTDEVEW